MEPKTDFQHLEKHIQAVDDKVDSVDDKVGSVLRLLQGNELDKDDKGFIGEFSVLKREVEALKDFKKKVLIYLGFFLALPTAYGIFSLIGQAIKQITGK